MTRIKTALSVVLAALVLTPGFVGAAVAHDGAVLTDDRRTGDDRRPTTERPAGDERTTDYADWVERLERVLATFDLTEDQRAAIVTDAERMAASGADRAEIRAMVSERLEEYGVDRDDRRHVARDHRPSHERVHHRIIHVVHRLGHHPDVTFHEALRVGHTLHGMYHDGASWSEMRATVRAAVGNAR